MSSLHIRNIDEKTLSSLKRLAKRHHRSLQGELHLILQRASELALDENIEEDLDLITVHSELKNPWGREDIYSDDDR